MAEAEEPRSSKLQILSLLLRPLVKYCVRNSHTFQELSQLARQHFVDIAAEELRKSGQKANISRISIISGLNRIEVTKYYREKEPTQNQVVGIFARVVGHWRSDPRYSIKPGEPRVLSTNEFKELVSGISKDINPGTVLFELERTGLIERTPHGLKHTKMLYNVGRDALKVFSLLSSEMDYHFKAVEENSDSQHNLPNLHLVTEYDNVFIDDIPRIREWLVDQGKRFHRKARNFISRFDKDIATGESAKKKLAGGKVMLSAFSFTDPAPRS